ncbi:MAG: hypothetical protein Q4G25_16485 [Paracoccus sp. (in: a-proteobacteria)]|nr:hypothetical protein [Paracoccus sp. (in: a-proteobacteria)]
MTDQLSDNRFPPAPEYRPHTSRPATPEERLYLRRFNLIRLMRYLIFWATFILCCATVCLLIWLTAVLYNDGDPELAMAALVSALAFSIHHFYWWRPVLPDLIRMRPVLRVPARVQVVCCHDRLTTRLHDTSHNRALYRLFRRYSLLELPSHWENMALPFQLENPSKNHPVEIARLPGASGKELRLKLFQHAKPHRIDAILPDLGDFILRFGDLSIARDMRARLPVVRASKAFVTFACAIMYLGLFATLFCWVRLDIHNSRVEKLATEISTISARYDAGEAVPAEGLAARGIDGLRPDPEFGQRVLHAAPVTLHEVRLEDRTKPFYLTEAELAYIQAISNVIPHDLSGYAHPYSQAIPEYRALLMARTDAFEAAPPAMAESLASLPEAVIRGQLRALSRGDIPDPAFVIALLPGPMIYRAPETNHLVIPDWPSCFPGDTLCGARDAPVTHTDAVFTAKDGTVTLQTAADLQRLAEQRAELAALRARTGPFRAFVVSVGVVLLAGLIWFTALQAALRVRQWYQIQAG